MWFHLANKSRDEATPNASQFQLQVQQHVVFFCDHEYESPLSIIWEFDRNIAGTSVPFFPDNRPIKASMNVEERSASSFVEMPSLRRFQPTALVVYGDDPKLPPIATKITIKLLSNDRQPIDVTINARNSR